MSTTRAFAALSPSCFTSQTCVSRFIHQSSVINSIVSKIWKGADEDAAKLAGFEREDTLLGFRGLKPESEIYWCNGPIALIHHDDFWDTVAKNVKVYRNDIQRLKPRAGILEDGSVIDTDMLLCGMGWTRGYPFLLRIRNANLDFHTQRKKTHHASPKYGNPSPKTQLEKSSPLTPNSAIPQSPNPNTNPKQTPLSLV